MTCTLLIRLTVCRSALRNRRELDFCGVYRLSKTGKLTLLTKAMTRPNGIALSPAEKILYVAQSDPSEALWKAFPVKKDGTLSDPKVFADSTNLVAVCRVCLMA